MPPCSSVAAWPGGHAAEDRIRRRPATSLLRPALSIWPSRSPCCSDWPSWIEKAVSCPATGARRLSASRLTRAIAKAGLERRGRGAQLRQLARLQPLVGRIAAAEDRRPALLVIEVVGGVAEHLAGDEALLGQRLAARHTAAAPWRGRVSASIRARSLAQPGLRQRQFLAAHIVQLLLDLGLARERRQLQVGVRQYASSWPLATVAPSSTVHSSTRPPSTASR